MTACDYSSARPGGAALAAAGIVAVGRYLGGDPTYAGALDAAELADLQAHGIAVWVNYEGDKTDMLGGYQMGVEHGQKVAANLQRLGIPVGSQVVYASADFDVQETDLPACDAYMDGFSSVLGPATVIGIYGGMRIINRFRANGKATWFWKAAASSWDHGETGFVHIEQTTNPSLDGTDNDIIYAAQFGQIGGVALASTGTPTPFQEDDMFTDNDRALLQDIDNKLSLAGATYGIPEVIEHEVEAIAAGGIKFPGADYNAFQAITNAIYGIQSGTVDVTALADSLTKTLGAAVVAELAERLSAPAPATPTPAAPAAAAPANPPTASAPTTAPAAPTV